MTTEALPDIVFRGQSCLCVRLGPCAYHVVTTASARLLGEIAWHPRWGKYCFLPASQIALDSRSLSEIGLWVRRLTRDHPLERHQHHE